MFTQNQITEAGHYSVTDQEAVLKGLAFNYDRKESDMNFYSREELQKMIDETGLRNVTMIEPGGKNLTDALQEVNDGKKLWKLCLILALVCLAAEILIIRLIK
jgi:hypothetical protein